MTTLPSDYEERVYAGVLGKIIGVYLGRPFEGWTYEHIMKELGEITYYVNDRIAHHPPLIVTDDDISGTFTFVRALADYGNMHNLTSAQIGQTWLNYLIERQTILWWGGMGNSTEHTAYMRLKSGIPAPRSGSIELNGKVVAEQIGAQIFIDGWAMVAPGDPQLAAELACKAASVSHDGEAVYGAQVLAAMEALAFVESNMDTLFDTAITFIPRDSLINRLLADVREWRSADNDWHKTRARIAAKYGYDKYGGGCHMIPNHAIIAMAFAYAPDDFQRALMIGNTAGWDTDCNSGNIGCLMGIKTGLHGIDSSPVDWRGPVADRMYLPTADGGRCITDAAQEARRIAGIGRALSAGHDPDLSHQARIDQKGQDTILSHKRRFDFSLPGSVHGFAVEGGARIENTRRPDGQRALKIQLNPLATGGLGGAVRVGTATYIPPDTLDMPGYSLVASPTLYTGQTIEAAVSSEGAVKVHLFVRAYGARNQLMIFTGQSVALRGSSTTTLSWLLAGIPTGAPIAEVGLQIESDAPGTVYLHYLDWSGAPDVVFGMPDQPGTMWQRAWVKACDDAGFGWGWTYRACQDQGMGLLMQGEREWANYTVQATVIPHLARSAGIAACVQGLKRYYALVLCDDQTVRLIKELDGRHVLAQADCKWELDRPYELTLSVEDDRLAASVDGTPLFSIQDTDCPLLSGAIALAIEEGRLDCDVICVKPA